MLGEQPAKVGVDEMQRLFHELPVRHPGQVRSARPQRVHRLLVAADIPQVGRGERPLERGCDLLREVGTIESRPRRTPVPRCVAEEGGVDVTRSHLRRAVAEHPERTGVEVAVAADDTEQDAPVIGELVGIHHPDAVERIAKAELAAPKPPSFWK